MNGALLSYILTLGINWAIGGKLQKYSQVKGSFGGEKEKQM